jgi:hypothetical protein
MNTCGVCNGVFGDGSFCISCGVSHAESESLRAVNNPVRQPMVDLRNKLAENRTTVIRGLTVLGVLLGLAGAQLYLIFGVGPNQTLDRYVAAIEAGDFAALDDQSLFPGAKNPGDTPALDFRDAAATSAVDYQITSKVDNTARANIDLGPSTYELVLASEVAFKGLFFIAEWSVQSEPQTLQVQAQDALQDKQKVTLPGTAQQPTVGELRDLPGLIDGFSSVLPGLYSAEIDGLGFFADTSVQALVTADSGYSVLLLAADLREVKGGNDTKAFNKAKNVLKDCLRSRCSKLPRLDVYDFALWSQYPEDEYTSSSFNKSFSFNGCRESSTEALSATKIRKKYSCDYTAKGHLYVRYYYYYGYYTDYYYYWNLYDTKSLNLNVFVDIQTNEAGTKENVGKAVIVR